MAFPSNPTNGQTYTNGNTTYVYNSTRQVWDIRPLDVGTVIQGAVVNNLTSTSTTAPLSAAQGKALNDNKLSKTGKAADADKLDGYNSATTATANTVAVRDGSANIAANLFSGTATAARYADLAEKYLADSAYLVGTVMSIGGTAEVTAATLATAHSVIGVVSENPAFMMNKDLDGGTYVALKGRVPVRVLGTVCKGDRLAVSKTPGVAVADNSLGARTFAIALGHASDSGTVEAVIL